MFNKMEGINFKKAFIIFFAALLGFGIIYVIAMSASGYGSELAVWLERISFARFRGRMFADIQGTFRFFAYLFLIAFNALLALWVYVDCRKHSKNRILWVILTLFAGLIGWLLYMIRRTDNVLGHKVQGG